jgi:hypothetical protein
MLLELLGHIIKAFSRFFLLTDLDLSLIRDIKFESLYIFLFIFENISLNAC